MWNLSSVEGRQEKLIHFPRRKPPRIRTDNFLQREHIHIVLTVPLFEPLLDDLVDVADVPGPLG